MLLFLAASWIKTHAVPETAPSQIVKVIERLSSEKYRFTFNQQNNSTETFISVCTPDNEIYGLVPFNTSSPLCWTYDTSAGQLKSAEKYKRVFETSADLNNRVQVFLEHQSDPNKGIWTGQQKSVCYSPEDGQGARNYCLKSDDSATATVETEPPTSSSKNSSRAAVSYTLLAVGLLIVGGVILFIEYRVGCIRAGCREYWIM